MSECDGNYCFLVSHFLSSWLLRPEDAACPVAECHCPFRFRGDSAAPGGRGSFPVCGCKITTVFRHVQVLFGYFCGLLENYVVKHCFSN